MRGHRSLAAWLLAAGLAFTPSLSRAQDEAAIEPEPDSAAVAAVAAKAESDTYKNEISGELTPSKGFDLVKTKRGSLNLSLYGNFRYLNQLPGEQKFTDHLGRERTVSTSNALNWHRTFVWLSGFLGVPKFRYTISLWSLGETQQTLMFGNLRYTVARPLTLGAAIGPNLTGRTLQGTFPFFAASDRLMGEEFPRGGFSSSFYITGEPASRVFYTAALTNNLSQLGVTQANDMRDLGYSASIWTMPTTGEFGPRGGFGDLESHQKLATRFGASAAHVRDGRYAPIGSPQASNQVRLSDGISPYETGALADTVTVQSLDYEEAAFDAGFKYKGFSFQAEYCVRELSKFTATGPLPVNSITDRVVVVQMGQMVVPRRLGLYAFTSYVDDQFKRYPWEAGGGASFYPVGNRSWRLTLHALHIDKSPAGSTFGYYAQGQTGTIVTVGTDILL